MTNTVTIRFTAESIEAGNDLVSLMLEAFCNNASGQLAEVLHAMGDSFAECDASIAGLLQ